MVVSLRSDDAQFNYNSCGRWFWRKPGNRPARPRWETAWAKSLRGGALLGQRKYAEAEPLLTAGYSELKEREARIPVPERFKLTEALDRVVQLYGAWGKKDKADLWRKKQLPVGLARIPLALGLQSSAFRERAG